MTSTSTHSGEMSQETRRPDVHPKVVIDPAARASKKVYQTLSMSSVGLEFGLAVIIGLAFGRWLDGEAGTDPWLMILFTVMGFAAGVRALVRAMNRADREAVDG